MHLRDLYAGQSSARVEELWKRADFPRRTMECNATSVDDPEQEEFVFEQNALHVAREGGSANDVRFLMKKGIFPCTVDSPDRSSLLIACEYAHLECAELVIAPDVTWSEMPDNNGRTPFVFVCHSSNAGLVKLLYRRGVDIHKPAPLMIRCPSGKTSRKVSFNSLTAAVISGSSEVVSCRLRLGVNYKTPSKCLSCVSECPRGFDGLAPLQLAKKFENDCIRRMVENCKRQRRETPVKLRAKKIGMDLPPTPVGVQDGIESGSPVTKAASTRALQRHQKACQQKVDLAKKRILVEEGDGIAVLQHERQSASNVQANGRSFANNGQAYLAQHERKKAATEEEGGVEKQQSPARSLEI